MVKTFQQKNIAKRRMTNTLFHGIFFMASIFGIIMLGLLFYQIFSKGLAWLDFDFITSFPSRSPKKAGLYSALMGSVYLIFLTMLMSVPVGVGCALYLEEYAKKGKISRLVEVNISNLAGIPSIVYGILGLALFVRFFGFGRSILAGAMTLALLILPVIIVTAREAIKSVPNTLREGSLALGASKWHTIVGVVLPQSIAGIMTGTILALSRALGEAAPLIMAGAMGYVAFLPENMMDHYSALPIQIFNWTSRPQADFQGLASAGIIVLLMLLLTTNGIAILIRNKYQKRY